jgi:hypothetical protein
MAASAAQHRSAVHLGGLLLLAGLAACAGELSGTSEDPVAGDPGFATLRRLNRTEYNNTVRDLLGDTTRPADSFPVDSAGVVFDNEVEVQSIPPVLVEQYARAAEQLAAAALAEGSPVRDRILTCDPTGDGHDACAREILTAFARRAFRRPVEAAEIDALMPFIGMVEEDGGTFAEGIALALQAILVDPNFLFLVEVDPDPTSTVPHRLSSHEIAARLSYFIYRSMPDDELFAAADAGTLSDPAELARQVDRMLADPKAAAFAQDFSDQWLYTRTLLNVQPSPDVFPDFDEDLRAAMAEETRMMFAEFLHGDHDVRDLLDADFTFANERLAAHYGIPGVTGSELQRVTFPADSGRAGLLTQASILTATSVPTRGSIAKRGKFIMSELLCQPPYDPPPGIPAIPDQLPEGSTEREILEAMTAGAECASCHSIINPLGGGLEHFDGVGRYREQDNGQPIDATGTLPDGAMFDGALGEAQFLKGDPRFTHCLTQQLHSFALGRRPQASDDLQLDAIETGALAGGARLRDLVVAIVTSDTFTARRGGTP